MALRDSAMSALVAEGLSHFSSVPSSRLRRNGTRSPLIACGVEREKEYNDLTDREIFKLKTLC